MKPTYRHKLDIRFFDIDANQHVNNSVYFIYMEHARTSLLSKAYQKGKELGITFVVTEANCKYKLPIFLNDEIFVEIKLDFSGAAKFDIEYRFISQRGQVHAIGRTTMACVDANTQRPVRIPLEMQKEFNPHRAE